MRDKWTGEVVKKMHIFEITNLQLAEELGKSPSYISDILNCKEKPKKAKENVNAAINRIIASRSGIETR